MNALTDEDRDLIIRLLPHVPKWMADEITDWVMSGHLCTSAASLVGKRYDPFWPLYITTRILFYTTAPNALRNQIKAFLYAHET
jgi:hypothetical protein